MPFYYLPSQSLDSRSWLLFATDFSLSDLIPSLLPCRFSQAAFGSACLEFPSSEFSFGSGSIQSEMGGWCGAPRGCRDPLWIPAWRAGVRCGGGCWQQMCVVQPALLFLLQVSVVSSELMFSLMLLAPCDCGGIQALGEQQL